MPRILTRLTIVFLLFCFHLHLYALTTTAEIPVIGVVLLHGKQGHSPRDNTLTQVNAAMSSAGMRVVTPEMAWSFKRLMDKSWSQAVEEIKLHIQTLRSQGAKRIVLAGQSLGSPAVMSYAVNNSDVDALVLISPGHTPQYFYDGIPYAPSRIWTLKNEVDRAKELVLKGKGDQTTSFQDINVGGVFSVWATPNIFLSYMAPDSDAEMSLTAPRIPQRLPVLWLIGKKDLLVSQGSAYVYDKLPPNPKSKYVEVDGGHFDAGGKNANLIVSWIQEVLKP